MARIGRRASLPARGRGSKPAERLPDVERITSLPARGRGSKRKLVDGVSVDESRSPHGGADRNFWAAAHTTAVVVAPRTGARIETGPLTMARRCSTVAPRTGARIETHSAARARNYDHSRSPHGGADRNVDPAGSAGGAGVAPRTGARIETLGPPQSPACQSGRSPHGGADRNLGEHIFQRVNVGSLPARGRGSKHSNGSDTTAAGFVAPRTGARIETATVSAVEAVASASLPARGRGSKQVAAAVAGPQARVAPRTGARIETGPLTMARRCSTVAPRTGARIETPRAEYNPSAWCRRSPHGGADRNTLPAGSLAAEPGRSPHGGADRNSPSSRR